jgi:hypothetical protein
MHGATIQIKKMTITILYCCPCFVHEYTPIWRPNPTCIHSSVEGTGHLQNTGTTLHCFKNGLHPLGFIPTIKFLPVFLRFLQAIRSTYITSSVVLESSLITQSLPWDYDQGTSSYITAPTPESWPRNPGTWSKWWRSRRDLDTPQKNKLEGCVPHKQVTEAPHPLSKGQKA